MTAISVDQLIAASFFVLTGPDGKRLCCQWTGPQRSKAFQNEFEIITHDEPDLMGSLFGMYDAHDDRFVFRPAICRETAELRPEVEVRLDWRGSVADVTDVGEDWSWDWLAERMVIDHSPLGLAA